MYTQKQIDRALTGELRAMYTALTGKATVDRNKVKLKKRVEKLNAEHHAAQTIVKAVPIEPVVPEIEEPRRAKIPGFAAEVAAVERGDITSAQAKANLSRRESIAQQAQGKRVTKKITDRAFGEGSWTREDYKRSLPIEPKSSGLAGMKARKAAKKVKPSVDKVRKKPGRKPTKSPVEKNLRSECNTRQVLGTLKKNQVLKHVFRQGEGESFEVECKVTKAPAADGTGGAYRYNGKEYTDLRDVMRACSTTSYNVLLFWQLAPWPKHKPRAKDAA